MFTSDDLIHALRRKTRRSIRPQPVREALPADWQAWLDSAMPAPHPAWVPLSRWQVVASLLRGGEGPRGRDQRVMRWCSALLTGVFHVFWMMSLIWLMYARFAGVPPEDAVRTGEDVIQVEYIGEGTPQEQGGGMPVVEPAPVPANDAVAMPSQAPAPAHRPTPEMDVAATEPPTAQAEAAPPPLEQPLQVTETPEPDSSFVVPPVRNVEVPAPRMPVPVVQTAPAEVRIVELPSPTPQVQALPSSEIAVPVLRQRTAEVVVREIPSPAPTVELPELRQPTTPAPVLSALAPQLVERALPNREPTPSPAASVAPTTPASAEPKAASEAQAPSSAPASVPSPLASQLPGSLPSSRRDDDWGDAARNRPGGQAGTTGLFDADGRPRLGAGGRVGGGLPPGTVTEDYEKIDRMGTWLKRPPTDYEPSAFDRFWVPHENLLEEWVRRSIKTVMIPFPGTSKSIQCSVALLMLGGSCGITDPNMQDVEAGARPPPDVPFKRELQEDRDSLGVPPLDR